jgi:hypothetical protein
VQIEVELLGIVNPDANATSVLPRKYVVKVTAEQISQWLQYERRGKGKTAQFKVAEHSLITIDKDVQRGTDVDGYLLQTPKKIMEIADTLLSPNTSPVPRLYLGSLTWNVRQKTGELLKDEFVIQKIEQTGKPPRYRLTFDTDRIFLTDSAHRHLAIAEAAKRYLISPSDYPRFDPKTEFLVELYTLTEKHEKEMFSELNAKQKKISASKKTQMDVSSPLGALKDAIMEYDWRRDRFFYNNIDVSNNQNDKHTLFTMSSFTNSIAEMFSLAEIRAARDVDEIQSELAEVFCEFFYALKAIIVVRANFGDGEVDVRPFRNLYLEVIQPAEHGVEARSLQAAEDLTQHAYEKAKDMNRSLRKIDIANNNAVLRALARLGGYIRRMEHWRQVIRALQSKVILSMNGKFFQKENAELRQPYRDFGIPIATLNEDGTLNVQVQTKTINAIYQYLLEKLHLNPTPLVAFGPESSNASQASDSNSWELSIPAENVSSSQVVLHFYTCYFENPSEEMVRLDLDAGSDWPHINTKSKAKSKAKTSELISLCRDEQYAHDYYEDICRWRATFKIHWPQGSTIPKRHASVSLKLFFPAFDNPVEKCSVCRTLFVAAAGG